MPRRKRIPAYTKHRASGQAVVRINGLDHYLGPHGSQVSLAEYDRVIAEWLARGRCPDVSEPELTVVELCSRYLTFAEQYYRKEGRCTGVVPGIKCALRYLRHWYGREHAIDFGPIKLKAVRQRMVDDGLSRRYVNDHVDRIRRMYKWGVGEELVPVTVYEALRAVPALQVGRTEARETTPVQPVADTVVEQTLPHLPEVVARMVKFQRLTGCRPGEVCNLRRCELDMSDEAVWRYVPQSHKTQHHGKQRVIMIGGRAQEVLQPVLARGQEMHCFRPIDSEAKRRAEMTAKRKTPASCGNAVGTNRKPKPRRQPGEEYSTAEYRKAIWRACDQAWPVPKELARRRGENETQWHKRLGDDWQKVLEWRRAHRWSPNQLRHAAGTMVRKQFGLEAAQVVLGHSQADTTQIYAERDLELAAKVAREVG